jgi:multidrug efflux pump subunit AcrB
MFGPLNGVRTTLVIGAGIAAIVAAAFGWWGAALVLLLAIGIHGLGWLYLYRRADHDLPPSPGS